MTARENISTPNGEKLGKSNYTPSSEICVTKVVPSQVTITIYILVLFASLIGNFLLIIAYARMKEKLMLLVANMAASDLLVAIFRIPLFITIEVTDSFSFLVDGVFGSFLCKICNFLSDVSLSVSTLSLVLITTERFFAVVHPLKYRSISMQTRRLLMASTWVLAAVFHSPYFYIMRLVSSTNNIKVCEPSWEPAFDHSVAHRYYNIFLFTTVLILPLLVVSCLHISIVVNLRRVKMGADCRTDIGARRNKKRSNNLKKVATATLTALWICWSLYIVTNLPVFFSPKVLPKCNRIFLVVYSIALLLGRIYCALNAWICLLFVPRFSRELCSMCGRKTQRNSVELRNSCIKGNVQFECSAL